MDNEDFLKDLLKTINILEYNISVETVMEMNLEELPFHLSVLKDLAERKEKENEQIRQASKRK